MTPKNNRYISVLNLMPTPKLSKLIILIQFKYFIGHSQLI